MNQTATLKNTLAELAKLQIDLDKKCGPSEDRQLFEQILAIQGKILKSFGLPISSDNEKLIRFQSLPTDLEVENRIKQLQRKATDYLLSDAKPDLQVLREAQELNQDPFIVLPELKISTHSYTLFVYNKMLLKKKDTVENILNELKFVNHPEVLETIRNIERENMENPEAAMELLKDSGVKYLDQFMISNSDLLSDDDY